MTMILQNMPWRDVRIVRDLSDAQMVVLQDFGPTILLSFVMSHCSSPSNDGFFIAPARQRQYPAISSQTLVPNVVDEAFDLLELWSQHLGGAKICFPLFSLRAYLKN